MNTGDAALAYACRGWSVFPCEPRGKRPLGRLAPHGLKDATTDPDAIRAWWTAEPEANVAIATGAASGLFVVDIDGPEGEDAYGVLLVDHHGLCEGDQPDGVAVRTPGGGWHLYAALPDEARVPNSAGRIAPRIDVRGDGGYVIAPPSIHPEGGRYVWVGDPGPNLPRPRPWILEAVAPRRPRTPPRPALPARTDGCSRYGYAALEAELTTLQEAPEGTRNHALNRAAFSVGQLIAGGELPAEQTRLVLLDMAQAIGLGQHEAEATVDSGLRAGGEWPRVAPERIAA